MDFRGIEMKKSLFERCVEIEKELISNHGHSMTKIIFDGPEGTIVMALIFKNEEEKDELRRKVKKYMLTNNIKEYVFSSECWVAVRDGTSLYKAPRLDVNKKQALVISLFRKGEKCITKMFKFEKEGDKIIWNTEETLEGASGMWNIWEDEKKVKNQLKELIKENDEKVLIKMAKVLIDEFGEEFNAQRTEEGRMKVMEKVEKRSLELFEQERQKILEDENENE